MTFTKDNHTDDMIPPMADDNLLSSGIVTSEGQESSTPAPDAQTPDEPPAAPVKKIKTETCVVSGETLPRDQMIRLVIGPDSTLYLDLDAKLPGTGFWITLGQSILAQAVRDGLFVTADQKAVTIPENMTEIITKALTRKALDMLSMGRKAGDLITGADKCEQVLRSRKGGVYVTAAEESAVTRRKLVNLARSLPVIDQFSSADLSTHSGAQNVWHAVIRRGPLCQPFLNAVDRLNKFNND
ncbi:DUF448 domain-containing protein [Micavibrio aeruginosavorus]|uniref:DUF448 domain-containing protein n=1 Tax=Micavibrio aeruginosavorus TaxID=349221 RepID=UPI003F4AD295